MKAIVVVEETLTKKKKKNNVGSKHWIFKELISSVAKSWAPNCTWCYLLFPFYSACLKRIPKSVKSRIHLSSFSFFLINVTQKLNQSILLRIWKMRWIRAGLSTSPLACSVSYWWLTAPKYANVPLQLLQTNPHSVLWAAWYGNYFLSIEIHPLTMTVQKICTTKGSSLRWLNRM